MVDQIFDSSEQFLAFIRVMSEEKAQGAVAVGVFGSRARGDHILGRSDVDVMVVRDGIHPAGDYDFSKPHKINIVRTSPDIVGNCSNSMALRGMRDETRWVWTRES